MIRTMYERSELRTLGAAINVDGVNRPVAERKPLAVLKCNEFLGFFQPWLPVGSSGTHHLVGKSPMTTLSGGSITIRSSL